jgi:hypothetical protein
MNCLHELKINTTFTLGMLRQQATHDGQQADAAADVEKEGNDAEPTRLTRHLVIHSNNIKDINNKITNALHNYYKQSV